MNTEINDIHTHTSVRPSAIQNVSPSEFRPVPGFYYSVGLHPWYLNPDSKKQWNLLETIAEHPQVMAIGETGLDSLRGPDKKEQIIHFDKHIHISEELKKPLIIHSVHTWQDIISIRKSYKPSQPWIMHGFRGKPQVAEHLLTAGLYLSFGEKFNEDSLNITPAGHLFIETDESILPVEKLYGKVAAIRKSGTDTLYQTIQDNIRNIFCYMKTLPNH